MQSLKFHLAIPSSNIQDSMSFYVQLGCKIGRFTDKYCIVDFFGSQVVCHLHDFIEEQKDIYPRHFGIILTNAEYHYMSEYCEKLKIEKEPEDFTRYQDTPFEHKTFFLKDPSGNRIEFKTYRDERAI